MKVCHITIAALTLISSACSNFPIYTAGEVPFVPTPPAVVNRMLELAEVKAGDVVYDIGSGDGRIVIAAAKNYGVKAVGIEIDGELVDKARSRAQKEGVAALAEFREQDALAADISAATVVTIYMLPEFNYKLRPQLEALKPGARVVCHDFAIEGWIPDHSEKIADRTILHTHTVYLYRR
ncbi:MAG TPA: class I SAM-dependent methyltransferase [Candidatus Binatia bacterium]|jgi:cyclopropane fatty-acyl-phospholipid synthase-like methyltransferase|nr:class I SAM-dependent methyltransferase [Candidatus Binatia bacterium]